MPCLEDLNRFPAPQAEAELLRCCGSRRWVEKMAAARPFASEEMLFAQATRIWQSLGPDDWKEAFGRHPRIGQLQSPRKEAAVSGAWASEEQAGVRGAENEVLERLARGNSAYEKKFGHLFLVCATGKSAVEMLGLLEARLPNSPQVELEIAAHEQSKITRLRLEKLLRS